MSLAPEEHDGAEAPPEKDPLLGTRLAGKYDLLSVLGEGAMGRIYRARQLDLDREIAIKILHKHLGGEDRVARRFHREARAASRLSHPNSVQILDFGSERGVLYIAMELLEGEDLQTILDHDGPLTPQRIAAVLIPVLRAVDEAHRAGIVHRDLKPENVIVWSDRSGREHVKVCDFGIAKILDGENNSITVDGFVCGTPQYMAPEQARGDIIDHRVDVYAAGVVLYQMLAGKVPFTGETALGIITKHLTDDPIPPSERDEARHVPSPLEDIALKAMAKSPGDRYQSAGEMADALGKAIAGLGNDAGLRLSDPELGRHSRPRVRRDPTDPLRPDASGKRGVATSTVDGEAATTELARAIVPAPSSARSTTYALVALAAVVLLGIAYLWSRQAPEPVPDRPRPAEPPTVANVPDDEPEPVPVPPEAPVPPTAPVVDPPVVSPPPTGTSTGPSRPRDRVEPVAPVPPTGTETAPPTVEPTSPGAAAFAEGRRLFLANDVPGAITAFETAARTMPRDPEVQRQLGRAYMRAGDVGSGVAAYRRYLELAPDARDRSIVERIIASNGG